MVTATNCSKPYWSNPPFGTTGLERVKHYAAIAEVFILKVFLPHDTA